MAQTANLGLTLLDPGQNQKEVTLNDNLSYVDSVLAGIVPANTGKILGVNVTGETVPVTVAAPLIYSSNTLSSPQTVGDRLRRAATVARRHNINVLSPWMVAPAWASGTTYIAGMVVQNAAKLYKCYSGGVASGSGPTGTSLIAPVADGTCTWLFLGAVDPAASSPDSPSLALTNGTSPTGVSNPTWHIFSDSDIFSYVRPEGSGYYLQYAGNAQWLGVQARGGVGYQGNVYNANSTGNQGLNATRQRVSFMTDAPAFAIGTVGTGIVGRAFVDGWALWEGNRAFGTGGGVNATTFDFSLAKHRTRHVTIELYGNTGYYGVCVDQSSTVWRPDDQDSVRAVFVGDSWLAGSGTWPLDVGRTWPVYAAEYLGWNDAIMSGMGGTGLVATASPSGNYASRIASDCLGQSLYVPGGYTLPTGGGWQDPHVIVICLSVNDIGQAGVPAAAVSLLATIRATYPTTIIVFVGCPQNANSAAGSAATSEKAVFDALPTNDPYLWLFPVSDTTRIAQAWLSGLGYTAFGGAGSNVAGINSRIMSQDKVHMIEPGMQYVGKRFAEEFRKRVLPNLP